MLFNLRTCVWTYSHEIIRILLLMLSPSVSISLPDIKHNFHLNLVITTATLVPDWSVSAVCVILHCMMWLLHSSGLLHQKMCMSFVLCVPSWVGTDPFQLGTHLHLLSPSKCWNLSYTLLVSLHQSHPCSWQSYSTCLYATSRSRHYLTTHCWDSYNKWSEV